MSVLIYGEHTEGEFKKSTFEAASYGADLAEKHGLGDVHAVVFGDVSDDELKKLGTYGVTKIHKNTDDKLKAFNDMAYTAAIVEAANAVGAQHVVFAQSYNGRALSPRVAVKLNAAHFPGVGEVPEKDDNGFHTKRVAFSNKGVQHLATKADKVVYTIRANAYTAKVHGKDAEIVAFDYSPGDDRFKAKSVDVQRRTGEISLTEAEKVVSAGRGLKGPENWDMVEELANLMGAATACSKPVADIEWRPHHEHVGQTGIQIAPNVYIAIGISGAIQHLAGVGASKTIFVINKDPEAPFFKAADYGVVGDAFDVVPKLIEEVKAYKAAN